jgi:hypothetical protein
VAGQGSAAVPLPHGNYRVYQEKEEMAQVLRATPETPLSTAGRYRWVVGMLLDKFQAGGYTIVFIICAFAYLVGFGLNHLCAPKFERFPAPDLTD